MATLADIGEDDLVRRLTQELKLDATVVTGAGDDCAVVRAESGLMLLKTDAVVEGVHFDADAKPEWVGRKAMARVLSDIAAMGGRPRHALVTLVLRPDCSLSQVEEINRGIREMAEQFAVNVVGGETSRGPAIMISICLVGSVETEHVVLRSGGKAGDALYVTGLLGGSIRGRHLTFVPRLAEGKWLTENFPIHAMMDLSDGLAMDLPRLAAASGVEFLLDEGALPCAPGCTPEQAWSDGEDYELLFAIAPEDAAAMEDKWRREFPELQLTRIGTLTRSGEGRKPSFAGRGWDHFGGK